MIEWIKGKICSKEPARVVLETGGVAFSINISLSTYEALGDIGEAAKIFIHTSFKNECLELFGFKTEEERQFFYDLLLVQGIGAKIALRVLSSIEFAEFKTSVVNQDVDTIASIRGIGRKRAEKLIVELKNRYEKEELPDALSNSAVRALTTLGIEPKKAHQLVREIKADSLEELIKQALKKL